MFTDRPPAEYAGQTGYTDQMINAARAIRALFICKETGMIQILFFREGAGSSLLNHDGAHWAGVDACKTQDAVVCAGGLSLGLALNLDEVIHLDWTGLGAKPVSFTYLYVDEDVGQRSKPDELIRRLFY
jgi:hypothetical protein